MKNILTRLVSLASFFTDHKKPDTSKTFFPKQLSQHARNQEIKKFWKDLYLEYFGMVVDTDTVEIPHFEFPGGYDLIIVFPISVVDLFRLLSKKMGFHDSYSHLILYSTGRKPALSIWDNGVKPVRDTKNGPYSFWIPKLHNHANKQGITAVAATLQEYLLQIAMADKLKQEYPAWHHRVLCTGAGSSYGFPAVSFGVLRFGVGMHIENQRVYIVGHGTITLPGFPNPEVPMVT